MEFILNENSEVDAHVYSDFGYLFGTNLCFLQKSSFNFIHTISSELPIKYHARDGKNTAY